MPAGAGLSRPERRRLRDQVTRCLAAAKQQRRNRNPKAAYGELINAGVTLASDLQDYRRAKRVYQQARKLCPDDPLAHYNLACLEARRNRLRRAMPLLRTAVQCGGDRIRSAAKQDAALAPLRDRNDFRELVGLEAVPTAQPGRWSAGFRCGCMIGLVAAVLGVVIALHRPISKRFFWSFPPTIQPAEQFERWLTNVLPAAPVEPDPVADPMALSAIEPQGGSHESVARYPMREWTQRNSQRKAIARFHGFDQGSIVLDRGSEDLVRSSWDRLSDQDQEYVRSVVGPVLDREIKRFRVWSDKSGEHTSRAAFVDVQQEEVVLDRDDGRQIRVPLDKLSIDDFDYVNAVLGGALRDGMRSTAAER